MNKKALSVMTVTSLTWWSCGHAAEMLGCLIEPDRVADVGTQSTGVLASIHVERGDEVTAGQVLARLSAQVERASVSVAEVKAKAEAEALQAQAAYDLAQRKLERTRDLVKRDFVSDQALDQAEAEARVAQQRVEQAHESQRVAQREHLLSNAQLSQREVRSPFAGLVVERYRTEGERIEREPVVRVARIDPLRIEAIVPAVQFGQIKAGQQASVKTDLPEFPMLNAQVTLVDRVIDPASNSFRVRLKVPNPGNRIPSGLRCRIAFNESGNSNGKAVGSAMIPPAPPAAAGSVAPARWQQPVQEPSQAARVTTALALPAMVVRTSVASSIQTVVQPATHVSSTLKFAMALLGRSTPGGRLSESTADLDRARARERLLQQQGTTLAMSGRLPATAVAAPAAARAAAPQVVAKARPAREPIERKLPAVAGVQLASVR
ncbi:MAG: efflux RND transporter periplasmic adaptor subunit [Aquabacterium sp.]